MVKPERDYRELLKQGRLAQIEKLRENDHKCGFDVDNIRTSFNNLSIERSELQDEIFTDKPDYAKIRHEAADVANFAFMIILKCVQIMYRQKRNKFRIWS